MPDSPDRRCADCRYWLRLETNPSQGECRRYAPHPEAFESVHMIATWPITNPHDWCGEFAAAGAEPLSAGSE